MVSACRASADVQTGENTAIVGGMSVRVEGEIFGSPPSLRLERSNALPPGTCLRIVWLDSQGRPIGSSSTSLGGGSVDIPAGADDARVEPCESTQDEEVQSERLASGPRSDPTHSYAFIDMPVDWSDGEGTWVEYRIEARSHAEAEVLATRYRAHLLDGPHPPEVKPGPTVNARILPDGRVRVTALLESAPTELDLTWNETPLFTLAEAQVTSSQGWYAVTCEIPASLVETPFLFGTATNTLFVAAHQEARDPWAFQASIQVEL